MEIDWEHRKQNKENAGEKEERKCTKMATGYPKDYPIPGDRNKGQSKLAVTDRRCMEGGGVFGLGVKLCVCESVLYC